MTAIETSNAIAMIGSPTALGGHFPGMDKGPNALRSNGLLDRIRARKALADAPITDHGDAPIQAGWAADDDPFMKNRQKIIEYMPRLVVHAHRALGGNDATKAAPNGPAPRLLVVGGDCTSHAGAMAALKRRYPGSRLAIAWFDAHGDFNIPTTTPSGNVWGMPFAMLCGRGDPGLVAAVSGPTVREEDAALLGAQVLDEQESRMLAASPVALFGSGMLAGPAGLAALETWARVVGDRTDGMYIAFDLDAIDASEGVSVAMPEPKGLSLWTATVALRLLAASNRIIGLGPTATMARQGVDMSRHTDMVAQLAEAALGRPSNGGPDAATNEPAEA
jgi:arginase